MATVGHCAVLIVAPCSTPGSELEAGASPHWAASAPGRPRRQAEDAELAALRAENARPQATVVELSIETWPCGESALGLLGPVPGDVKDKLLAIVDHALAARWSLGRICGVLELDRARLWRWRARAEAGRLDDLAPGANPIHALLPWEVEEIRRARVKGLARAAEAQGSSSPNQERPSGTRP